MRLDSFWGAAFLALALPAPAAAAEPAVKAPIGKWVVDFGDAQCIASRNYGTEADPLLIGFKAPAIGNVVSLLLVRKGQGGAYADQVESELTLSNGRVLKRGGLVSALNATKQRMVRINLPLSDFADFAKAGTVGIRVPREFTHTLALKDMPELVQVLDACVLDLRKYWNVTGNDEPSPALQSGPKGNLQDTLRSGDFPSVALQQGSEGTVRVALLVDEAGKVADCTVVNSSGAASLDAQSCYWIQKRAKFVPAVGLDGKPARSAVLQSITWLIRDGF